MARQQLDKALELADSVIDEIKADCEEGSSHFEKLLMLHKNNEEKSKRYLDTAKEILQRLEREYKEGEEEGALLIEDSFSESNFKVKKETKVQQAEKITQDISDLEKQKAECDKEIFQLSEQFKVLGEKKEKVVKESSQFVPWKKGELALFTTTTGIHWNFGCNDNEIRGYVAGKNCIKPFSINSDEHDSFHIANYLWDVIESAYKI